MTEQRGEQRGIDWMRVLRWAVLVIGGLTLLVVIAVGLLFGTCILLARR